MSFSGHISFKTLFAPVRSIKTSFCENEQGPVRDVVELSPRRTYKHANFGYNKKHFSSFHCMLGRQKYATQSRGASFSIHVNLNDNVENFQLFKFQSDFASYFFPFYLKIIFMSTNNIFIPFTATSLCSENMRFYHTNCTN